MRAGMGRLPEMGGLALGLGGREFLVRARPTNLCGTCRSDGANLAK